MVQRTLWFFALAVLASATSLKHLGAAQQANPPSGTRAASKTAGAWTPPRTAWGDPDLQGLWPSIDMQGTPLERPADFGTRALLNDQEFASREEAKERQVEADAETTVV